MLTPAGQIPYREITRIHQTAAEAIHHIHLPPSEAALLIHLLQAGQAVPHTADRVVIQFLQEAQAAVLCPQDLIAVEDHHLLPPIAEADQYQEAVAGPPLQVVHHPEVLHQVVHHLAAAVAEEIRSSQINILTI